MQWSSYIWEKSLSLYKNRNMNYVCSASVLALTSKHSSTPRVREEAELKPAQHVCVYRPVASIGRESHMVMPRPTESNKHSGNMKSVNAPGIRWEWLWAGYSAKPWHKMSYFQSTCSICFPAQHQWVFSRKWVIN